MKKVMEKYFMVILVLYKSNIVLSQDQPRFTVERNSYGVSDRLIEIEEVDKDADSFKNDGTCFGTKENIASRFGEARIRCFSNLEVYYLDGECEGGIGIVAQEDITYPLCDIQNIADILLWGPEGWKKFDYNNDTFLLAELSYKGEDLVFQERRKWDGIFMRIYVNCLTDGIKCITLKFVGRRTYPLPDVLADILVTPPPTTPPPTTTSLPTTEYSSTTDDDYSTTEEPVIVITQNAVTVAEQNTKATNSKTGLVIGVVFACIFMLALITAIFISRRKENKDKKLKGDTTLDMNVYNLRSDNEKSPIIGGEELYTTPTHHEPEYRELEPEYVSPTKALNVAQGERPYDVPERNEELPSAS